jgi:CDP-paratose 2-epimerase
MRQKCALVTGSGGLIGSEAVRFFAQKGFRIIGIDNDMRKVFFGANASTAWNIKKLKKEISGYRHFSVDIRDNRKLEQIFKSNTFDLIIHAAAQPSHDWAACAPLTDFSINADATLYLLENFRRFSPEGVFIFLSTNKVYGDTPNTLSLIEEATRYEIAREHPCYKGIDETMSIDRSLHSLFGASKAAADLLVQEYGRYFGLKTACFRGGCLTGSAHSGAELHGFLSYLGACVASGTPYKIYGYKGKQVRDNIHASDLVLTLYHFYLKPKCAEVYNIGGSRFSNVSVLEAIEKFEKILKKKAVWEYIDKPRAGDHIWYISDVSKFKKDYPDWDLKYDIDAITEEICEHGRFQR